MQIQNNYNTYSGAGYQKTHTHHITECLQGQEEKPDKETAASGGKGSSAAERHMEGQGPEIRSEDLLHFQESRIKTGETGLKKLSGLVRQAWDSLGDEKGRGEEIVSPVKDGHGQEVTARGLYAVQTAVKQLFSSYIVEKWEDVKDRVKAGAGAAFKRFGKRNDAFSALSDPRSRFMGKREKRQSPEKPGKGTRRARVEILTADSPDSHLMDSYSKTGEYCRLNENLSRRQERRNANRRAFSEDGSPNRNFSGGEGLDKRL